MRLTVLNLGLLVFVMGLLYEQNHSYAQKTDAFPHIDPNRLQFFEYESIQFSCDGLTGSSEWRVSKKTLLVATRWVNSTRTLRIHPTFEGHSGQYWCENGEGKRSSALNVMVTAGDVILDSPVLPLREGQSVTLHCRKKSQPPGLVSDFYKDGHFKGTGYKGTMTILNASLSDDGLYKCSISGAGESPESLLSVRADNSPTSKDEQHTTASPPLSSSDSQQLTIWLSVSFAIFSAAVLVTGLFYEKLRVRQIFPWLSRTESAPVYANYRVPDQEMTVYANVPKKKNKRGRQGQNKKRTQDAKTPENTTKKERGSVASVIADAKRAQPKKEKGLQAKDKEDKLDIKKTERERRAYGTVAAPGTKKLKERKTTDSREQK